MGTTKSAAFSVKDNTIAKIGRALSHPARVAILKILLKKQGCICGDIVEELPLSQSTISQHLKALKEAGLIKGEIEGVTICYCIDEKHWKAAQLLLNDIFNSYQQIGSHCC